MNFNKSLRRSNFKFFLSVIIHTENKPCSTNVLFKLYIRYTSISFTFFLSLSTETHKNMKLTYNTIFIFVSSYKHNTGHQFSLSYSVSEKSQCWMIGGKCLSSSSFPHQCILKWMYLNQTLSTISFVLFIIMQKGDRKHSWNSKYS